MNHAQIPSRQYGDKTRNEVDAELLLENKRTEKVVGHECDGFISIEQVSDYILEHYIELLPTEFKEKGIEYLIEDINKFKSEIFKL